MRPLLPGRDVHIALGNLAYTGAASPGPQRFIDTRKPDWRGFASTKPRWRWWSRPRGGLAAHVVAAGVIGALATLSAMVFAFHLHRPSTPALLSSTETARAGYVDPAHVADVRPPIAAASAAIPVVPEHVLGAAASRASGGPVVEAGPLAASAAPAPLPNVVEPVNRGRRAAERLHQKPRHPAQKAGHAPGRPERGRAAAPLEPLSMADGNREHASSVNRPGASHSPPRSFHDVLVAIKDASTIIVANQRGMPTIFRVGDKLPSGAVLVSVDPSAESAHTDRGPLKLE